MELMKAFHAADLALTANVTATSTRWSDGLIEFDAQARWEPKKPDEPGFRQIGDEVVRAVDGALERALPPEILDMTGDPSELVVDLAFRARYEYVTWAVPFVAHDAMFAPNKAGALSLLQNGRSEVDLSTAALGQPLDDTVWDVRMRTEWVGMERKGPLLYRGQVLPAVLRGRARVAYSNASKGLSLDLAQRLRTLAIDAKPRSGNAGPITGFSAPLDNVTTFGETTLDASMVVAIPDDAVPANLDDEQAVEVLEKLAAEGELGAARVVANTDGARFEGGAALPAGRYTLYARREGKLHATKRSITVDDVGQAQFD